MEKKTTKNCFDFKSKYLTYIKKTTTKSDAISMTIFPTGSETEMHTWNMPMFLTDSETKI